MIYNSIIEAVGNTPLVRLNKINKGVEGTILAKVEYLNPGNSVKDRIAIKMIEDAEKTGKLKPGGTIIEGTSGNTGMGLALMSIAKGYKCIFTMVDKQSQEKIDSLKAVGAEVILCPTNVDADDPQSYHSVAKKLNKDTPNSFYPNQYDNISNLMAHYESTGPEIWQQTEGKITHYVAAVGTGGSMSGTSKYLKEKKPTLLSIGIDTYGSLFKKYKDTGKVDRKEVYPYLAEGFGSDILPNNVDFNVIDQFVKVTDKDGAIMARKLAREEGLFAGWSSGSIVHGALEYAKNNLKRNHTMVVLLPDHGTRYLKKIYNDSWMAENGFLDRSYATAKDIIQQRSEYTPLCTVSNKTTIKETASLMAKQNIYQVPVVDRNEFVGSITMCKLLKSLMNDPAVGSHTVEEAMEEPMPFVSMSTTLDVLHAMMGKNTSALLVGDLDENIHMITQSDILKMLSQ